MKRKNEKKRSGKIYFESEHAIQYGINEAILLNYFTFWISLNEKNKAAFIDGYTWTYHSCSNIAEELQFMSERQVKYAIKNLLTAGILIKGEYNKAKYDKTNWYRLSLPSDKIVQSIGQNCPMDKTKLSNPSDKIVQPIHDNKHVNKKDDEEVDKENLPIEQPYDFSSQFIQPDEELESELSDEAFCAGNSSESDSSLVEQPYDYSSDFIPPSDNDSDNEPSEEYYDILMKEAESEPVLPADDNDDDSIQESVSASDKEIVQITINGKMEKTTRKQIILDSPEYAQLKNEYPNASAADHERILNQWNEKMLIKLKQKGDMTIHAATLVNWLSKFYQKDFAINNTKAGHSTKKVSSGWSKLPEERKENYQKIINRLSINHRVNIKAEDVYLTIGQFKDNQYTIEQVNKAIQLLINYTGEKLVIVNSNVLTAYLIDIITGKGAYIKLEYSPSTE